MEALTAEGLPLQGNGEKGVDHGYSNNSVHCVPLA
jgi:hypothetical protein